MRNIRGGRRLALASMLAGVSALSMSIISPLAASASTSGAHAAASTSGCVSTQQVTSSAVSLHVGGIDFASGIAAVGCDHGPPPGSAPYSGDPPLLLHSSPSNCIGGGIPCFDGNMMMTPAIGALTIVPIFWDPSGFPMSSAYKSIITGYLQNVAKDSGHDKNVFSVLNQYTGTDGQVHYNVKVGPVVNDTDPITSTCIVDPADTTGIYADGTGYSACIDDGVVSNEVDAVRTALSLPDDLTHIYVLYLAQGVESCFFPGATNTPFNACTINHLPSAAYCAYHSFSGNSGAVYANMPFPDYHNHSALNTTLYTCGSDARSAGFGGTIQSPNGNLDADVEISPTSHEISESITDPDTQTGWYDAHGNEIGDDCAYIYGGTNGPAGGQFNQVINGQRYLTQEEFSNSLFASSGGAAGCAQSGK